MKSVGYFQLDSGEYLNIFTRTYFNGSLRVELWDEEECPYAVLSVNIPEQSYMLSDGEFFVKNWSENEWISKVALERGPFEDTGMRIPSGFVRVPVWRIVE